MYKTQNSAHDARGTGTSLSRLWLRIKFTLWQLRPVLTVLLVLLAAGRVVGYWKLANLHSYEFAVAAHDLNLGGGLEQTDVEFVQLYSREPLRVDPAAPLSEHLNSAAGVLRVTEPVSRGTVLGLGLQVDPVLALPEGYVQISVKFDDQVNAARLRPGQRIDVVAQDPTGEINIVTNNALVLENSALNNETEGGTQQFGVTSLTQLGVPRAQALEILSLVHTHYLSALITQDH